MGVWHLSYWTIGEVSMTLLEGVMWIIHVYVHHKEFFPFSQNGANSKSVSRTVKWGEGSGGLGD